MFALIALAAAGLAPPTSAPRCTAATVATCAAGRWTGAFIGADWTIELTRQADGWTGRYITTRGRRWQPLQDLSVAGDAVTFGIASTPKMTFRLRLDPAADTLTGEVDLEGHRALPFAAARTA